MDGSLHNMSDQDLMATLTAIYQTQDARAEIPTCRFCGAVFTPEQIEAIQQDEHLRFFLTGIPDDQEARAHDCQHIAPPCDQ